MFPPQSTPSKRPKRRVESYRIYKRPYSACSQSSRPSPSSYEKATHGRLVGPTLSTPRGDKYYNQYRPPCEVCPRDRGKVVGTLQGKFKSSNIINVKNTKDNKCFLWSILAKLYPADNNKERVTKYKPYENENNMNNIEYPVLIKDISKVEKQNSLNINVFALEDQTNKQSLYPVYISNVKSENRVDLLYVEENENTHYCLIKDLDSFLCDENKHKQHTCRNCLQRFRRLET